MICENCGIEHSGFYGSGRFCSEKCSRGFSTKAKRNDINQKVSKSLSKNAKVYKRTCKCGQEFETNDKRKKYCSLTCSHKLSQIGGSKKRGKDRKLGSGGLRSGGGKSKQLLYINWLGEEMKLNPEEIEVAKILDQKLLNWSRNWKGFPYTTKEGNQRKFYPDFVVEDNLYIEYKGWVTEEMEWKMQNSIKTNDLNLLIIIGKDLRYQKFGINLETLKILKL
jgi:hypothetical protein